MLIRKSPYFDTFSCIAAACPDSCCKEWEVLVDEASAKVYRSLEGSLGEDLRRVLRTEDGNTYMTIQDGSCPMWRSDGLCRIQAQLGEDALCATCRDFPRLRHDYGSFQEWGLELSCPEAARLILSAPAQPMITMEVPGEEPADYDQEAMESLLSSRRQVHALLADTARPIGETLALVLLWGCQAQSQLDGAESCPFAPDAALETARSLAKPGSLQAVFGLLGTLEILTPEWAELLRCPSPKPWDRRTLPLARYLADRYWLQAVSDYDLYSRAKLLVILCLVANSLEGGFGRTAQLLSKELENNAENIDALLDAAYQSSALTDDKLLGLLLMNNL